MMVQVCTVGGASWSLGGVLKSFGGALRFWRPWSLEVHKCLIGALSRYLEALDVHVCTFQHCWYTSHARS